MNQRPFSYGYGTIARAALAVLALDQVTKEIVRRALPQQGDAWPAASSTVGKVFQFLHAHNTGVAFGLAQGRNGLFLVIALLVVVLLLVYARGLPPTERWMRFALGCQIGGALGNAVDRLRLGHVTDFLDLHYGRWHWPTFNVADTAINVGVWLLILRLWRMDGAASGEAT
ncbi:MAG TPA: signal peptidase II [Anaerolineae bacterium]|nr:signal peptidase II [Ardenticatenia bacterium]MBK8541728.1 signal peptidase II [Ardenticatenia bacterium]HQZ72007.1 signal peptidase II [Anaerolineae bacterium]HRA19193.1 signal peptidase II [Anaerolineae bacterium]